MKIDNISSKDELQQKDEIATHNLPKSSLLEHENTNLASGFIEKEMDSEQKLIQSENESASDTSLQRVPSMRTRRTRTGFVFKKDDMGEIDEELKRMTKSIFKDVIQKPEESAGVSDQTLTTRRKEEIQSKHVQIPQALDTNIDRNMSLPFSDIKKETEELIFETPSKKSRRNKTGVEFTYDEKGNIIDEGDRMSGHLSTDIPQTAEETKTVPVNITTKIAEKNVPSQNFEISTSVQQEILTEKSDQQRSFALSSQKEDSRENSESLTENTSSKDELQQKDEIATYILPNSSIIGHKNTNIASGFNEKEIDSEEKLIRAEHESTADSSLQRVPSMTTRRTRTGFVFSKDEMGEIDDEIKRMTECVFQDIIQKPEESAGVSDQTLTTKRKEEIQSKNVQIPLALETNINRETSIPSPDIKKEIEELIFEIPSKKSRRNQTDVENTSNEKGNIIDEGDRMSRYISTDIPQNAAETKTVPVNITTKIDEKNVPSQNLKMSTNFQQEILTEKPEQQCSFALSSQKKNSPEDLELVPENTSSKDEPQQKDEIATYILPKSSIIGHENTNIASGVKEGMDSEEKLIRAEHESTADSRTRRTRTGFVFSKDEMGEIDDEIKRMTECVFEDIIQKPEESAGAFDQTLTVAKEEEMQSKHVQIPLALETNINRETSIPSPDIKKETEEIIFEIPSKKSRRNQTGVEFTYDEKGNIIDEGDRMSHHVSTDIPQIAEEPLTVPENTIEITETDVPSQSLEMSTSVQQEVLMETSEQQRSFALSRKKKYSTEDQESVLEISQKDWAGTEEKIRNEAKAVTKMVEKEIKVQNEESYVSQKRKEKQRNRVGVVFTDDQRENIIDEVSRMKTGIPTNVQKTKEESKTMAEDAEKAILSFNKEKIAPLKVKAKTQEQSPSAALLKENRKTRTTSSDVFGGKSNHGQEDIQKKVGKGKGVLEDTTIKMAVEETGLVDLHVSKNFQEKAVSDEEQMTAELPRVIANDELERMGNKVEEVIEIMDSNDDVPDHGESIQQYGIKRNTLDSSPLQRSNAMKTRRNRAAVIFTPDQKAAIVNEVSHNRVPENVLQKVEEVKAALEDNIAKVTEKEDDVFDFGTNVAQKKDSTSKQHKYTVLSENGGEAAITKQNAETGDRESAESKRKKKADTDERDGIEPKKKAKKEKSSDKNHESKIAFVKKKAKKAKIFLKENIEKVTDRGHHESAEPERVSDISQHYSPDRKPSKEYGNTAIVFTTETEYPKAELVKQTKPDTTLQKMRTQVKDVTNIMKNNIEKVSERGEKLEQLEVRTDCLDDNSRSFMAAAKYIKDEQRRRRRKYICAIVLIIILVLSITTVVLIVALT